MKNIILIILTVTTLKSVGQNNFLGIIGGANLTNATSVNFLTTTNKTGFCGGLTYEYLLKKHFSFGADIIYNQRGFNNDIVFTDKTGNPTGITSTNQFNYDYISIPLKVGYNIGNKFYGFANIGVSPSFLIDAKTKFPTIDIDGNVNGSETLNVTNNVTKFDLAGLVEIGGGYKFKDRYWLFTSFAYQQSFTTITNSDYFTNSTIKHYGLTFSVGLKYSVTKL